MYYIKVRGLSIESIDRTNASELYNCSNCSASNTLCFLNASIARFGGLGSDKFVSENGLFINATYSFKKHLSCLLKFVPHMRQYISPKYLFMVSCHWRWQLHELDVTLPCLNFRYLFCCSYSHNVAPNGKYIAFVTTEAETNNPEEELKPGIDLLGPVDEIFFDTYDRYEPTNQHDVDSCFISAVSII